MRLSKPQKLIYDMEKFVGGSISVICGCMLFPDDVDVSDMQHAINEFYRLNDALRIRISESGGEAAQTIYDFTAKEIETLSFADKSALNEYAEKYAKEPLNFYGELCEFKIITLPKQNGVLVKLHHIIGDAWTLSLIGNQLNTLLRGKKPEAYSYADYLESEDTYTKSKRNEKDRAFYLEQFKKCDEVTYLSEKPSDSYASSRKTFILEREKAAAVMDYARRKNISVFTLFTAALSVYMNRVKMNAERFYIGTAVLNRGSNKEKNTMGMFINTIPMLIELDNQKSFAENLSEVEGATLSALRHQKYNYGDVLADLRKEYSFTEKLYDVIISYQNASVAENGIETTWYHSGCQTESLQIHIDDRDNEGIFRFHYDYLIDKFTEYEIEMLNEHIMNLLFSAIENDDKKIYELSILSDNERQKVQFDFNDTSTDYPKDKCVHQIFEAQAEKTPDKIAVVASDKSLTYRELNEEANKIANSLLAKGVKTGDIVAIILPRNAYLIPAMFGVLKTGAAYMPLDPSYPQERIDYLIAESGAGIIINEDTIHDYLSADLTRNPDAAVTVSSIFCALHTSGSTGKPKVTALTQQNLLNFLYANLDFWENVETVISVTIVTFDIFMQDSLLSLALGKKVVLASNDQIYNQAEFEKMFENEDNVMFFSTPTKLMAYIKQSNNSEFLQKITSLIVGGEVFTDELYDLLSEKLSNGIMHNGYGPTESTLGTTFDNAYPHENSNVEIYSMPMDRPRPHFWVSNPSIPRIVNGYGPAEATIGATWNKDVPPSNFSIGIYNGYGPTETTLGATFSNTYL